MTAQPMVAPGGTTPGPDPVSAQGGAQPPQGGAKPPQGATGAAPGTEDTATSARPDGKSEPSTPSASQESESNAADGKVASGDEAGAATSRSGDSTFLHESLRQAQHLIEGDLVGNKFVFLHGSEERVALRVLERQLQESVRHAFVNPADWDDLRMRASQRRAVILRGAPGRGRTATAIRLLQAAQTQTVYNLDPNVDLNRFGADIGHSPGADDVTSPGYLLSQPSSATQFQGWLLEALEEALDRCGGRLVMTVGPEAKLDQDDLARYVVDMKTHPSTQDILAGHLRWRRGDDEAEQLLAHVELKDFIATYLVAESSFEITAQLAAWIAHEPVDAVNVERVRGRLARRRDGVEVWFDSLPDLGARCSAIALAVLDGLSNEDVAAAARSLYRRLDTAKQVEFDQAPTRRGQGTDAFAVTGSQRLQQLHATAAPGTLRSSLGHLPATVISFRHRDYAKKTIVRAWQEYQIQEVLLEWLVELSQNSSEQVRAYAGTALGVISTLSFDYVANRVLRPAAASRSRVRREGAAVALRVAAEDPRLLPAVKSLVGGWYGADNLNLKAAAASAYGLVPRLGGDGTDPTANVDALDRLATVDSVAVAVAIGDSLSSLIFADSLGVTPKVYATLTNWFDDRKRAATGHLAFLMCAVLLITEVGEPDPANPPTTWPTLLLLAREHQELRQPLFALWHRVLDEAVMHAEADAVLTAWAGMAESDADLRDAFVRMVRVVASYKGRTRQSIVRLAADWVSEERLTPLPTVSAAIGAVI